MSSLEQNIAFLLELHPELRSGWSDDPALSQLESLAEHSGYSLENLLQFNLSAQELPWSHLSFIFLDVDGVMTEGGMFYTDDGDEFKRFDTKDGMAIKEAMKCGLRFGIISSGINERIIKHRADMFGIEHVYVGTEPKMQIAEKWLQEMDLDWTEVGYIGDDINDLQMFGKAGLTACPADATDRIKSRADFVLQSDGGHGCIREFMRYFPQLKNVL